MSISRPQKIIFRIVAVVLVTAVVVFACGLYRAWHKFVVEDNIHGAFFPVVMALGDYSRDHSSPATNLTQLIPHYLTQIPSSRFADSVEYKLLDDGKAWQFSVHSGALNPPRIYCCRSTQTFTADEEQRVLLKYHGFWVVLKEE